MKRNPYGILLLLTILIVSGCGLPSRMKSSADGSSDKTPVKAYYDISLISAERPTEAQKRFGDQIVETVRDEGGIARDYFEDAAVRIVWWLTADEISFVLTNKTNGPVTIVWAEAKFVDENGLSHSVIHSGISYNERFNAGPPTVLARKSVKEDFIHPADYVQLQEAQSGKSDQRPAKWERKPLLPNQSKGSAGELKAKAESFVGKTLQVHLPLQIEGIQMDYLFTFRINKVNIVEERPREEKTSDSAKGTKGNSRKSRF